MQSLPTFLSISWSKILIKIIFIPK